MQELWARITRIPQWKRTWCLLLNVPWRSRLPDGIVWIVADFLVLFSGCVDIYIKGKQESKQKPWIRVSGAIIR